MKVHIINNDYEFSFLESINMKDFHTHILNKIESYQLLISKLEDCERTYTDFNMIELVKIVFEESKNHFLITMKVNDLLAYDKSPFYYKNLVIRF